MNLDRAVLALAGTMVLVSVLLAVLVSTWWLLLATFVGLNLVKSSVTGFCPAAMLLSKLGLSLPAARSTGAHRPVLPTHTVRIEASAVRIAASTSASEISLVQKNQRDHRDPVPVGVDVNLFAGEMDTTQPLERDARICKAMRRAR